MIAERIARREPGGRRRSASAAAPRPRGGRPAPARRPAGARAAAGAPRRPRGSRRSSSTGRERVFAISSGRKAADRGRLRGRRAAARDDPPRHRAGGAPPRRDQPDGRRAAPRRLAPQRGDPAAELAGGHAGDDPEVRAPGPHARRPGRRSGTLSPGGRRPSWRRRCGLGPQPPHLRRHRLGQDDLPERARLLHIRASTERLVTIEETAGAPARAGAAGLRGAPVAPAGPGGRRRRSPYARW